MALMRRKRRAGFFRTRRFLARFRRSTQAELFRGNRVELFRHGGDFFPSMLREFSTASSTICLEFYIIRNDGSGKLFTTALCDAVRRGVAVYLIYDYFGCIDTPSSFFRGLEDEGVRCIPFNPPSFKKGLRVFDRRNHRKFAVIDGATAFMGGVNIGDEYTGFGDSVSRWRDTGIRIEGPAATGLTKLFMETWEKETGLRPDCPALAPIPLAQQGSADIMIVNGGPHHTRSFIRSSFRLAIAGASKSVKIITPYFVPGPLIVRSLLRAAKRGIHIQIVLPSISDVPLAKMASKAYLSPILKSGIEVYEREGTVLHAKVMLIDDCWTTLGSANLDFRSFHRNYEVNAIIDNPDFGEQVSLMFSEDLSKSRRITLEEHEARTWFEKLLERLCDPLRRFL
jgi:cardiolipin synthase A/B